MDEELRFHSSHLTAWLRRIERRLLAKGAEETADTDFWIGVRLASRLDAGELLAGAAVRHRELIACASALVGRHPRAPAAKEARRCARHLSRRWRATASMVLRPGWLWRHAERVLTGLTHDLQRLLLWIGEIDFSDLSNARRELSQSKDSVELRLKIQNYEVELATKLKVLNAVERCLEALHTAPSRSRRCRKDIGQELCLESADRLAVLAERVRTNLCELWLQLLEAKYAIEPDAELAANFASISEVAKHSQNSGGNDDAFQLHVTALTTEGGDKTMPATCSGGQLSDELPTLPLDSAASADSGNDCSKRCSWNSSLLNTPEELQPHSAAMIGSFSSSRSSRRPGDGRSSSRASSSHRLAERADRHFWRRQLSRQSAGKASSTDDESGLEASGSQSSNGSSSDDPDGERRIDLEQLWDYSCQPDLYSEAEDDSSASGRMTLEDWELQEHQMMELRMKQYPEHWRTPEAVKAAAELAEARRRLRGLRKSSSATTAGETPEAAGATADELRRLGDKFSCSYRSRYRLPRELLDQRERLARELLAEEAAARVRQFKGDSCRVGAVTTDAPGGRGFACAAEAAARLCGLQAEGMAIRRGLATLANLRARLGEAARCCGGGVGGCWKLLARARLDEVELMRQWMLEVWQRCVAQQASTHDTLEDLQQLEAMVDSCRSSRRLTLTRMASHADSKVVEPADFLNERCKSRINQLAASGRLSHAGRLAIETQLAEIQDRSDRRALATGWVAVKAKLAAAVLLTLVILLLVVTTGPAAGWRGNCGSVPGSPRLLAAADLLRWTRPHGAPI